MAAADVASLFTSEIGKGYGFAVVNFANPDRAPLLLISGDADRPIPPAVVRRMLRAHQASPARTDFRSFPGRTHWLILEDGWDEVAGVCLDWITSLGVP
jgi:pimeloyl-ACP methyl ester carboxylesterase